MPPPQDQAVSAVVKQALEGAKKATRVSRATTRLRQDLLSTVPAVAIMQ